MDTGEFEEFITFNLAAILEFKSNAIFVKT
ncbi:hypothetical protein HME9304_00731 [Flagellimonas maritima]|uniref:Uncharacterized protein n=1 Tax=Flagellimonas maritima TaxID=1383885 RepID=A0A2Z4LPR2_9FLAO|nr:hypothetical protein HME9304_00731 [Allomuricauda aurantiaca]